MNKDEVIALAEKCKLAVLIHSQWTAEIKEFTVVDYVVEGDLGSLMQFADLVASAEREACAKVCDEYDNGRYANAADLCVTAIRARGQEGDVGIIRYADISVGKIIHNSSPPQRTWVGLTDEEVKDIVWNLPYEPSQEDIRAIEAKLKEKNNG